MLVTIDPAGMNRMNNCHGVRMKVMVDSDNSRKSFVTLGVFPEELSTYSENPLLVCSNFVGLRYVFVSTESGEDRWIRLSTKDVLISPW